MITVTSFAMWFHKHTYMHAGDKISCSRADFFNLIVPLTDLLTIDSNQLVFVSNCTEDINMVKFSQQFVRNLVHKVVVYDQAFTEL